MERTASRRLLLVADQSPSERAFAVASKLAATLGGGIELLELARSRRGDDGSDGRCARAVDRVRARLAVAPMDVVVCADHGAHRIARSAVVDLIDALLADGVPVVVVNEDVVVPASDLPVVAYVGESPEAETVVPTAARWANSLGVPLVLVAVTPPSLAPPQVPPSLAEPGAHLAGVALRELAGRTGASWPQLHVSASLIEYRWERKHALALFVERHPAQLVVMPVLTTERRVLEPAIDGSHSLPLLHELAVAVALVPGDTGDPHWSIGPSLFADSFDHL